MTGGVAARIGQGGWFFYPFSRGEMKRERGVTPRLPPQL